TVHLRQFIQTNFSNITLLTGSETEFRQTTGQRLLTAFETGSYGATGTGFQTFMTTTAGFSETATDTTTYATRGMTRTRFRSKFVQTHLSSPQPVPGN